MKRRNFILGASTLAATSMIGVSSFSNNHPYDVAIIGAGLAGLNAAQILEDQGLKTIVIEANSRVGGKLLTANSLDGNQEIGGTSMGSGYKRLIKVIDKYQLKPYSPGKDNPYFGTRATAIHLSNTLISTRDNWGKSKLNPFPSNLRHQYPWERLRYIINDLNPLSETTDWYNPLYSKYDISLHKALQEYGLKDKEIHLVAGINPTHGNGAKDISILQYFFSSSWVKDQSNKMDKSKPGIFQIRGGNSLIPQHMAASLKGDLVLNTKITNLKSYNQGVRLSSENGMQIDAKTVITSIPLTALSNIEIDTQKIEADRLTAINNIGYSKVNLIYFKILRPFWEYDELPLTYWTDTSIGRIFTVPGSDGNPAYIKTWTTGSNTAFLDKMSSSQATAYVLKQLILLRPSLKNAIKPALTWSWQNQTTAGGTYVAWQPGEIKQFANIVAKPIPPLFFAGEYTAKTDRGMEGAMESGERAAAEVINYLG